MPIYQTAHYAIQPQGIDPVKATRTAALAWAAAIVINLRVCTQVMETLHDPVRRSPRPRPRQPGERGGLGAAA